MPYPATYQLPQMVELALLTYALPVVARVVHGFDTAAKLHVTDTPCWVEQPLHLCRVKQIAWL